jgi:hypothetical protein
MAHEQDSRDRIWDLIDKVRSAQISVQEFCVTFERIYNFDLDLSVLTPTEAAVLKRVFDTVTWYSPFPDERVTYPHYRDEADVMAVVDAAYAAEHRNHRSG